MAQYSQSSRFLIALTGSLVVVAATWAIRHPSDATRSADDRRSPTSLKMDAAKRSRIDQYADAPREGKASGSFGVTIVGDDGQGGSIEDLPQAAQKVHLKAIVTAQRHIASHEFTWIFPTNYKLIDGPAVGTVPELQPGQRHELTITIDRGGEPRQPIVLHVFKVVNSEPRGQIAQFDIPPAAGSPRDPAQTPYDVPSKPYHPSDKVEYVQ